MLGTVRTNKPKGGVSRLQDGGTSPSFFPTLARVPAFFHAFSLCLGRTSDLVWSSRSQQLPNLSDSEPTPIPPSFTSLFQYTLLPINKGKMHVITLAVIGLCAGLSAAAQLASAEAFDITNLSTHQVTGGNTTIEFTIHDPDPLTNTTTNCTGTWEEGTDNYPSPGYQTCTNRTFGWNMDTYSSFTSFTLNVKHTFEDPAVGDYPYNMVTTFGEANITGTPLKCTAGTEEGSGWRCQQQVRVIKAPIYATSA
ncbi:hypothetical protein D0869_13633 [Hortaea werneckii]|uniref:Uncharacterized protein n=1 Tax=Hortaea werneckii TaxID=91943 RepID=A0A3M6Y649_HORWE|nr:hypothetical protein D0869_13633 [Hortaea werneckii]RMX92458.1 hypothetical protein D0868_13399 [Hortaea werneckii]RMX98492.1 hypothetical protein D0867_12420 [Hortaea werneckii]RMY24166.1 hypothetical protein D0866_11465 [Hortaea werneckii]